MTLHNRPRKVAFNILIQYLNTELQDANSLKTRGCRNTQELKSPRCLCPQHSSSNSAASSSTSCTAGRLVRSLLGAPSLFRTHCVFAKDSDTKTLNFLCNIIPGQGPYSSTYKTLQRLALVHYPYDLLSMPCYNWSHTVPASPVKRRIGGQLEQRTRVRKGMGTKAGGKDMAGFVGLRVDQLRVLSTAGIHEKNSD